MLHIKVSALSVDTSEVPNAASSRLIKTLFPLFLSPRKHPHALSVTSPAKPVRAAQRLTACCAAFKKDSGVEAVTSGAPDDLVGAGVPAWENLD